jgi:hypothetical protein
MISSFETLPPELFRFILSYLSPEDASALAQTCHQMNIITRDEEIWRQYYFKRYISKNTLILSIKILISLFRYTYFTRILQYSNEEYLSDSALKWTKPPDDCTWQEYFRKRAFEDKDIRLLLNEIIVSRITRKFI